MNYRDELLTQIEYHEKKVIQIKNWIAGLDADGFDWDNVTDTQKWAIENSTTKEVQQ